VGNYGLDVLIGERNISGQLASFAARFSGLVTAR
jgi:hypothetical protein